MPDHRDFVEYGSMGQFLYWISYLFEAWKSTPVQQVAAVCGTIFLGYITIPIYCHSETGSWALVTGASDGIGYGFAEELLDRGFNVLLHGRNPVKLGRVIMELSQRWPRRQLDFVVADAAHDDDGFQRVADKAKRLPGRLTILVNNVGGAVVQPSFQPLSDMSPETIDRLINVNLRFPTKLTAALMATLKAHQPSLVVNCGSSAGETGMPYLPVYSAAKAFNHTFSLAMKNEMQAENTEGIDVVGCVIGNTVSGGNKSPESFFTISSRECARSCLDRASGPEGLVYSHWRVALQMWTMKLVPETQLRKMIVKIMGDLRARERELSKAQ